MPIDADMAFVRNPFKSGYLDAQRFSIEVTYAATKKFNNPAPGHDCNLQKGYPIALRLHSMREVHAVALCEMRCVCGSDRTSSR